MKNETLANSPDADIDRTFLDCLKVMSEKKMLTPNEYDFYRSLLSYHSAVGLSLNQSRVLKKMTMRLIRERNPTGF